MNISKVVLHLKLGDKGIQLTSLALYGARCQDQYKKDLRFLGAGDEQSGEIRMCGRVEIGQQVLQAKLLPFLQMTSKMRETQHQQGQPRTVFAEHHVETLHPAAEVCLPRQTIYNLMISK